MSMRLDRYSFGVGDRFGSQGEAQLKAFLRMAEDGIRITPVWNKSDREHLIIGSSPADVRSEADAAVCRLKWAGPYFVDADHVTYKNVNKYIESTDYFTLDVSADIGGKADPKTISAFMKKSNLESSISNLSWLEDPIIHDRQQLQKIVTRYWSAAREAKTIYELIKERKGRGRFITEVSLDETRDPMQPIDIFIFLSLMSHFDVPLQAIAPRFHGWFYKGIDYIGDIDKLAVELVNLDRILETASETIGLPSDLKLSIHSGSDKFSVYPILKQILVSGKRGVHVKTSGTTWLAELCGLAFSGGDGLELARTLYHQCIQRFSELTAPYSHLIDINRNRLPDPDTVAEWSGVEFSSALNHNPSDPRYNRHFRQLLHIGYKLAAERSSHYSRLLHDNAEMVGTWVTDNILENHLQQIFPDKTIPSPAEDIRQ